MVEPPSSAVIVLIAEDETLVRMLACEMLQDAGYKVDDARDGQEALAILEVRGENVKALVTDIAMPNLGGVELAAIVSSRWPHIGIVLTSANPPVDVSKRIPERAKFLAKPYKERDLVDAVETVLLPEPEPVPGPAAALHNFPLLQAGQMHGAGGLAQPLPEPDE